jgi:hypothetical protein
MLFPTKKTVIGSFENFDQSDIFQVLGPGGSISAGMDASGLVYPARVPVVQNALLSINTNKVGSVSNFVPDTAMYNIALFMESYGDGGSSTCVATIEWTNAQGNVKTVDLILHGSSDEIQQENYVLLAGAGSTITVSTAFTGAAFHYDGSFAIAILPTIQVTP